jgi:hypothetical protein
MLAAVRARIRAWLRPWHTVAVFADDAGREYRVTLHGRPETDDEIEAEARARLQLVGDQYGRRPAGQVELIDIEYPEDT